MFEHIWRAVIRRQGFGLLSLLAFPLWIASLVYRLGSRLARLIPGPPVKAGVPVVSIGNITVGGSGKTPLVGLLAGGLLKRGLRVGIVSSGYGRHSHKSLLMSGAELQTRRALETGDEMLLLAHSLPEAVFSIEQSKAIAAKHLGASGRVDVILVDDGFQHRKLHRDLDIITYDVSVETRLLRPFPYGILREQLTALKRAHVVVLTRIETDEMAVSARRQIAEVNPEAEVYNAHFSIAELVASNGRFPVKLLSVRSALLFAGIGSFDSFVKQVRPLVRKLDFALELADHQRYNRALLMRIKDVADRFNSECVVTTGKDWVKVGRFDFGRESYYLELKMDLEPSVEQLISGITETLKLKSNT